MCSAKMHRVCTYNVRRFSHGKDKLDMVDACIARLKPLMPISLLALNEVDASLRPHALAKLSDALGLAHVEFFGHVKRPTGEGYGNALLSMAPLTQRVDTLLDGGSVVKFNDKEHRIGRGLLTVHTHIGEVPVRVGVTHLDHMVEQERVTQARHVLRVLMAPPPAPPFPAATATPAPGHPSASSATPHLLLLGDLNALMRADYSADQWAAHEAHNAAKGWGAPRDSATASGCLGLFRAAGFDDCVRRVLHCGDGSTTSSGQDGSGQALDGSGSLDGSESRTAAWQASPWSAHVYAGGPRYRIDYILSRPPPPNEIAPAPSESAPPPVLTRLACVGARIENATDDGGRSSDHCPVAVDFVVESPGSEPGSDPASLG